MLAAFDDNPLFSAREAAPSRTGPELRLVGGNRLAVVGRDDHTARRRPSEASLVDKLGRMILTGLPEEDLLPEIAREIEAFEGAKVACIVLRREDRNDLEIIFSQQLAGAVRHAAHQGISAGEGITSLAMRHGKTVTCRDVRESPTYRELAAVREAIGFLSVVAAPLRVNGEVLGTLTLLFEDARDFSPRQVATVERLGTEAALAVANARQIEALRRLGRETATALAAAIEARDEYTGHHCVRMAERAGALAMAVGLSITEAEAIQLAATLHDIGKIVVPDQILRKPGRLTRSEKEAIQRHCESGAEIVRPLSLLADSLPVILHHHEWFDGSGYPHGLTGDQIPIGARIVAVADAYDAMTSDRPYRRALSHSRAVERLRRGAGTQWDPEIVQEFLKLL